MSKSEYPNFTHRNITWCSYHTKQISSYGNTSVFDRCWVEIFAGTLTILTEGFRGLSQSFQADAQIIPQMKP